MTLQTFSQPFPRKRGARSRTSLKKGRGAFKGLPRPARAGRKTNKPHSSVALLCSALYIAKQDRNILPSIYTLCDYNQAQSLRFLLSLRVCDGSDSPITQKRQIPKHHPIIMSTMEAERAEKQLLDGEETDYIGRRPSSGGRDTKRIS